MHPPLLFHPHGEHGDVSGGDAADAAGLAEALGADGGELFAGFVAEARYIVIIDSNFAHGKHPVCLEKST